MTKKPEIQFGFQFSAVDAAGTDDAGLYRSMLREARHGYELGYDVAWAIEHHFSSYFVQPSPISILSHVAAQCPGMGLGTMVLVLPWYQPVRLAGDLATLSQLTTGDLHIGMGRGNAPLEYEAFDVPMSEAKDRYAETWEILKRAMTGEPFSYEGENLRVPREIRIRPKPDTSKLNFYGAIGNPASATKIADLGLAPISNGTLDFDVQKEVLKTWNEVATGHGMRTDVYKPVGVLCIIADTDDEARKLARQYLPRWFELQVEHYAYDAERHKDLPDYRPFAETHARRIHQTNPDNLDPLFDLSFIGSAETVRRRVQDYIDLGFNSFILQSAMPDIPEALRRDWLSRFARDVAPHFASSFAAKLETAVG